MSHIQIEEIPLGDSRLRDFVQLPWRLYRGDPCWTPPLTADYLGNKLLGSVGLLTPQHPYHKHAEVTHFLARRDGALVGRISAAVNHRFNAYYDTKIGFFGFFETIEDFHVAKALLDSARDWLKARGMEVMRGPGEYSNATHERQGILIEGFQYPPTIELTHNPPFYGDFMERYGLRKAKDYVAYIIKAEDLDLARIDRVAQRIVQRKGIETPRIDLKDLKYWVRLIIQIYNEAWSQNWGFLPITQEEADMIAHSVKPVLIPEMLRVAFIGGEPVAVFVVIPDLYVPLRPRWKWPLDTELARLVRVLLQRRRIPRLRVWFFGVRPPFRGLGLDAVLFNQVAQYAIPAGYREFEPSLLLEDNEMIIRISEAMGGKKYKTWRIYDMDL